MKPNFKSTLKIIKRKSNNSGNIYNVRFPRPPRPHEQTPGPWPDPESGPCSLVGVDDLEGTDGCYKQRIADCRCLEVSVCLCLATGLLSMEIIHVKGETDPQRKSGSMEPAFYRGDLLFLTLEDSPIRVGEICVFKIRGRDIPIVHRVIKVHNEYVFPFDIGLQWTFHWALELLRTETNNVL